MKKRILISIVLTFILTFGLCSVGVASGDCKGHSCNGGTNTNTDVDVNVGGDDINIGGDTISIEGGDLTGGPVNVSTGGNKSLALGNVLGDVDIGDCLGSTQWSTPVYGKQKLSLNWVCMAEQYMRWGQPHLAAMALCNTDMVKEFANEAECEEAHQFLALIALPETAAGSDDDDEDEDVHNALQSTNMMLQAEIEELRELYERQPPPVQKTIVEQRPLLTETQRSKLKELKQ